MEYKNILIGLFILLLTISPASAATTVDQTVNLPIPEVLGISLANNNLTFKWEGFNIDSNTTSYSIENTSNVPIDLLVKANSGFTNNITTIPLTWFSYLLVRLDGSFHNSILANQNSVIGTHILPGYLVGMYQKIFVPNEVPPGNYSLIVTYTALKST